jgi:hypothetical protein
MGANGRVARGALSSGGSPAKNVHGFKKKCRNPSFGLATKAKRGCKGAGLREA